MKVRSVTTFDPVEKLARGKTLRKTCARMPDKRRSQFSRHFLSPVLSPDFGASRAFATLHSERGFSFRKRQRASASHYCTEPRAWKGAFRLAQGEDSPPSLSGSYFPREIRPHPQSSSGSTAPSMRTPAAARYIQ